MVKRSFVHLFIHSFVCLFSQLFICSFIHSFIHSFILLSMKPTIYHSFVHSFICSSILPCIQSSINPCTHLSFHCYRFMSTWRSMWSARTMRRRFSLWLCTTTTSGSITTSRPARPVKQTQKSSLQIPSVSILTHSLLVVSSTQVTVARTRQVLHVPLSFYFNKIISTV